MECTVDRKELTKALTTVNRAISRRAVLPVLSGVKLSANGRLELSATDLEVTIEASIAGYSETDGVAIAPSRDLAALVKAQRSKNIVLGASDGEIRVNGARIKAMSTEDYPAGHASEAEQSFTIGAQELKRALQRTVFAASTDESRQVLTGILWEGSGELVATDSYRLAVAKTSARFEGRLLISARAVKEVIRAISKKDDSEVEVSATGRQVTFVIGSVTVTARLIEGDFPNYRQLIPQGYENVLEASTDSFLATLAQVSPMAQNNLPVKLELLPESDGRSTVTMSASTPDIGEASAVLECGYVTGTPMVIAFNPDFLADGVDAAGTVASTFTLRLKDGLKPVVISSPRDTDYLYLLMPVRLS